MAKDPTEVNALSLRPLSRREFLINLIMALGALLGLGGLATRFMQFLYPVIPPLKFVEVQAARLSDIPKFGALAMNLSQGSVMIVNNGKEIRAFSAICTHLGCIYHWEDDKKRFLCPCHNGVFDINGKVISGPPPRPLDEIKTVVRGNNVFVRMKSREESQ